MLPEYFSAHTCESVSASTSCAVTRRLDPDGLLQRLSLEELRHDVRRTVVGADVLDCEDVRVIQRARRAGLLIEAPETSRVTGEGRRAVP